MDRRLESELALLADRDRRMRLYLGWSACWFAVALAWLFCIAFGRITGWSMRIPVIAAAGAGLLGATWVYLRTRDRARNLVAIARRIERQFPSLDQRLLAAIEIESGAAHTSSPHGYLQGLVVREAVEHRLRYDWQDAVPIHRLGWSRVLHGAALAVMTAVLVTGWRTSPAVLLGPGPSASRMIADNSRVNVEPGDAAIERGTDVLVLARFAGPLPADVHVVFGPASAPARQLPLSKSLNDPLFGGRIPTVTSDIVYHVEFDTQQSREYHITVFDYPDVQRIDAEITLPNYTGAATQRIEDTRHVSAVEGSAVTLICALNKPVVRAWLTDSSGETVDLSAVPDEPTEQRVTITLTKTQRYALHLVDADGRENKIAPEITLTAVPNRPSQLVLNFPAHDMRASPLEELTLQAQAWDDFGISSYGVTYTHGTEPAQSITLGQGVPAKEKRDMQHMLFLEEMRAQPDQLLSYYFWADDAGPDGSSRRTSSDLFFVEVRPFEEIFRQGQQPTESEMQQMEQQNQGGAGQQAAQLAELQKQIISATWNLIRQRDAKPAARAKDVGVVRDSQQSAREQLQKLAEEARTPTAIEAIEEIDLHMTAAIEQLNKTAADPAATEPLQPALASEQAAYQALLKLRAREFNVVRSNQRQQRGASSGNRSDRQLSELELDSRENRYENRRDPKSAQQQAATEDNQVLNRLRELARRQEDLNKRVQELQSALQAARDEEQRQELQRQLARLREEQQEMLRDLDELRDRMDRPENQQRMADARQQLEQTRQDMRRASESLSQEQLSSALNAGTRAERELEEVRDDFRRRSAKQFSDEMRAMRDDARQLADREQDLGNRIDEMKNAPRQALRDDERSNFVEQMGEQRKRLDTLTDDIKTLSEAAETPEPLLSKQLYDLFRDTTQRQIDRSMELTSELMRRGFVPEAGKSEQNVRKELDQLLSGVERAARSVLGDPAEATRRALDEVQQLSRQLQQEIARADPEGDPTTGTQRDPNGNQRDPNGNQRDPNGTQRDPNGTGREPNGEQQDSSQAQRGGERSRPEQPGGTNENSQRGQGERPGARSKDAQGSGRGSNQNDPQNSADAPSNDRPATGTARNQPGEPRQGATRDGQPNRGGGSGAERNPDIAGWTEARGPITGEGYREWSDRLRDVEEMLESPDLRAEVADINDRARDVRRDWKRHSQEPNWSMVRQLIAQPLVELQTRLREELARQESHDNVVPIDRDPVPRRYSDLVRQYYERLGSGK